MANPRAGVDDDKGPEVRTDRNHGLRRHIGPLPERHGRCDLRRRIHKDRELAVGETRDNLRPRLVVADGNENCRVQTL